MTKQQQVVALYVGTALLLAFLLGQQFPCNPTTLPRIIIRQVPYDQNVDSAIRSPRPLDDPFIL